MSIRRLPASSIACAAAVAWALAGPSTAHAQDASVEDYLRCVARERAEPLRDADATAALLKLERYAICYRLNLPARRASPPADLAAAPCPDAAGSTRRAARALRARARQQARLHMAVAHATVHARDARALAAALSGEDAAHALRVARDLERQATALQRHVDAPGVDASLRSPCPPPP